MQVAFFDNYADEYDQHFTFSEVGKLQRTAVYGYLLPLLNNEKNVLEINCGTGYDAVVISKHVRTMLATDISAKMIEVAQGKKEENKCNNLDFEKLSIQELNEQLVNKNLVFSNFGGLNCLSPQDLESFSERCNRQMSKNNELLFVIMGKKCIWERLYFTLKGDLKKASRRKNKNGAHTIINNSEFNTWYYSPNQIKQLFEKDFKVKTIKGIGLFVPPSYLNPFFRNKKILLNIFDKLDKVFCNFKWTANYADHYLIHLKKEL